MNFDKKAYFQRAQLQIDIDTEESLRYACFELRGCMEAIVYEYVDLYKDRLPKIAFETYQPKKVLEILSQYESNIGEDYTLDIYTEGSDKCTETLVFSQAHSFINIKFLKHHYNKIGSYLHCPTFVQIKKNRTEAAQLKEYLLFLMSKIKKFLENTFHVNLAEIVTFECKKCHKLIARNLASLHIGTLIECFN